MPATVAVISQHGAAGATETTVSGGSMRFKRADDDTANAAAVVPIPSSGVNYSWRKNLKIKITASPDNAISNLRFFTGGSAWATGVTLFAKTNASYVQGGSGDESAQLSGSVDASTYTSASPLAIAAGQVIANPDTGYGTQDFLQLQGACGATATRGNVPAQTLTWRFDES